MVEQPFVRQVGGDQRRRTRRVCADTGAYTRASTRATAISQKCEQNEPLEDTTQLWTNGSVEVYNSPARPNAYEMRPTMKESEFPVAAAADTLMPALANILAYS
jgi:hypothetical protein